MKYLELLWNRVRFDWDRLQQFIYDVRHYYGFKDFAKHDLKLKLKYLFRNPFRISKKFLIKIGETDVYSYGETPLETLELICKECDVTSKDLIVELGCGRGRACLWLSDVLGAKVIGIDFVPEFIRLASSVGSRVDFRCRDMFQGELPKGTVYYLYCTCMTDEEVKNIQKKLAKSPKGTKVITVSQPLDRSFKVEKEFIAPFDWGDGKVYLNVKIN